MNYSAATIDMVGGACLAVWPKITKSLRTSLYTAMQAFSPTTLNNLHRFMPRQLAVPMIGDQLHKIASILNCTNLNDVYGILISADWVGTNRQRCGLYQLGLTKYIRYLDFSHQTNDVNDMMFRDIVGYLCDDILTKVDRASMATSLETRSLCWTIA